MSTKEDELLKKLKSTLEEKIASIEFTDRSSTSGAFSYPSLLAGVDNIVKSFKTELALRRATFDIHSICSKYEGISHLKFTIDSQSEYDDQGGTYMCHNITCHIEVGDANVFTSRGIKEHPEMEDSQDPETLLSDLKELIEENIQEIIAESGTVVDFFCYHYDNFQMAFEEEFTVEIAKVYYPTISLNEMALKLKEQMLS